MGEIMKKILLAVTLAVGISSPAARACEGLFVSAHAGAKIHLFDNDTWQGNTPVSFAIGNRFAKRGRFQWDIRLTHDSNLDRGWPRNNEYETSREAFLVGVTYSLN